MTADLSRRQRAALAAYSSLLRLLAPLNVLRLKWRARAEPTYGVAIGERFGLYGDAPSTGRVWIHAVSLGETRAAAALVDALRQAMPSMRLLLTHGTATGREAGRALLRDGDAQVWLPDDTPGAVRRFLRHVDPAVGVLMETEIWPNLQREAARRGLPMVLANGRLSARSLRRGRRLEALMRPAVEALTLVLAQTDADAERFRSAGVHRVVVSGNLKFDMTPDATLLQRGRVWRAIDRRPVVMAAATREGEEAGLLQAWLDRPSPRPRLLLVPRHPQRFDDVAALIAASGLSFARRSLWGDAPDATALRADVWLGDSMGEMPLYYAVASVALLGGSFAPLGGQNLIEAAACGCPLLMGPHTFNFDEAARLSLAAGAAERVDDAAVGVARAMALCGDPARLATMSAAALAFAGLHRGAAGRMAADIVAAIDRRISGPAVR